jgi:phosphoglycerate dehydrogenase-like enzyme
MGERPVVAVTFEWHAELARTIGDQAVVRGIAQLAESERARALRSADCLAVWNWRTELRQEEKGQLDNVRLIQLVSAGADHLPFEELPPGVIVASNVTAYAEPMAEHVLAMTLALLKRLNQNHAKLARGIWNQDAMNASLKGAVCGIVGLGGIGKATARLLRAFGARIHAINTSGETDELVDFIGTLDQLDELCRNADVLVIALPLTTQTRGLIGSRELGLMKPTGMLVNVARGAIVDQGALYEHLRSHPEFSAGIDAWWVEPFNSGAFRIDYPFFDLPNVLGSPHNSAHAPGVWEHAAQAAAENILRFLRGEEIIGIVRAEDYA